MVGIIYNFLGEEKIIILNKNIFIKKELLINYDISKLEKVYYLYDFNGIYFNKLKGNNLEDMYINAIIDLVKLKNSSNS